MFSVLSRHPLARDITAVVAVKGILIILASMFLFPKAQRPVVNAEIIAQKFFGATEAVKGVEAEK